MTRQESYFSETLWCVSPSWIDYSLYNTLCLITNIVNASRVILYRQHIYVLFAICHCNCNMSNILCGYRNQKLYFALRVTIPVTVTCTVVKVIQAIKESITDSEHPRQHAMYICLTVSTYGVSVLKAIIKYNHKRQLQKVASPANTLTQTNRLLCTDFFPLKHSLHHTCSYVRHIKHSPGSSNGLPKITNSDWW